MNREEMNLIVYKESIKLITDHASMIIKFSKDAELIEEFNGIIKYINELANSTNDLVYLKGTIYDYCNKDNKMQYILNRLNLTLATSLHRLLCDLLEWKTNGNILSEVSIHRLPEFGI